MKLRAAILSTLLFAVGCKTDAPESTARSSAAPASEPTGKARSGKIQLERPNPPRADRGEAERPRFDDDAQRERGGRWGDPDASPEERRERRAALRKEREAALDTNQDGKVSPEEMAVARTRSAEEMRARFDADGDGKLTAHELGESRMSRRFGDPALIDTDKNGDLSVHELASSMEQTRTRMRGMRRDRDLDDESTGGGSAAP